MATSKWTGALAHKLSINYWTFMKKEDGHTVLRNPAIKKLSFFDPQISEGLRRNDMRIVAGEFFRHFAQLGLQPQRGGLAENDAYLAMVEMLTEGAEKLSATGDLIDRVYRFRDEE